MLEQLGIVRPNELQVQLVASEGQSHGDIEPPTIQHIVAESDSQNLADEGCLLSDTESLPPEHKLSSKSALVVSFFLVVLDSEVGLAQLVERKFEGTASPYFQHLGILIVGVEFYQPETGGQLVPSFGFVEDRRQQYPLVLRLAEEIVSQQRYNQIHSFIQSLVGAARRLEHVSLEVLQDGILLIELYSLLEAREHHEGDVDQHHLVQHKLREGFGHWLICHHQILVVEVEVVQRHSDYPVQNFVAVDTIVCGGLRYC